MARPFMAGMDAALAFHAGQSLERRRHNAHLEMGFAPAAIAACGAGMSGMAVAFVHHLQPFGRKSGSQFFADRVGHGHEAEVPPPGGKVKRYVFLSFTASTPYLDDGRTPHPAI